MSKKKSIQNKISLEAEQINHGKHYSGEIKIQDEFGLRDELYKARHVNNGNCHHWWTETGFAPPTITVNHDVLGHLLPNPVSAIDQSKPAEFRMLKREPWQVKSPKGFRPGEIARFKYPELESWRGDSARYADLLLLDRWDFPGLDRSVEYGPQVAWRVMWVQFCSPLQATGAEFRIPEWRLKVIRIGFQDTFDALGKLHTGQFQGETLKDKFYGNWSGT